MKKLISTLAAVFCASTFASSAQAFDIQREALFVMGMTDAQAKADLDQNLQGYGHGGLSYLWVKDWPRGRGPINGTVDLKQLKPDESAVHGGYPVIFYALPTATDPDAYPPYWHTGEAEVKVLNLTIKDSEVVGFEVDIQIDRETTSDCALGYHSIKGNQDGIEVVFKEQHEEGGACLNRDWEAAPFGKAIKYYDHLCDQPFLAEFDLTFKEGLGCYWMENVTGEYCWVGAPQGDLDLQACMKQDSCDGGGNASRGGCYKYAVSSTAPRKAWPEE